MFQREANVQLTQQYGLPSIRDRIDFAGCDAMVKFNIEQVEAAVLEGLSSGVLRPDQLSGKIVDFGCGRGVSTAVFQGYGADVVGVELSSADIAAGTKLGFVPADKLKCGDGLAYLNSLPAGSLDLVSASMLGPDINGGMCRNFLIACRHALKPGGTVLVTSDAGTLPTLERVNPLGNGFIKNGVFLAVRGMDPERSLFGKSSLGAFGASGLSFEGLDFTSLLAKFRTGDNK